MITPDTLIDQILTEHPELAAVFVQRRMLCVGCDMGRFHTLAESADLYGIDAGAFIAELNNRLAEPGTAPLTPARTNPSAACAP